MRLIAERKLGLSKIAREKIGGESFFPRLKIKIAKSRELRARRKLVSVVFNRGDGADGRGGRDGVVCFDVM